MNKTAQTVSLTKQCGFTRAEDHNAFALVRLDNRLVRHFGGRNQWVVLQGPTQKKVYRMVQGTGRTPLAANAMECDYETSMALGIPPSAKDKEGYHACQVVARRANKLEVLQAHWHHPDHYYRLPFRISLLALQLGVVGVLLGVMSFFH